MRTRDMLERISSSLDHESFNKDIFAEIIAQGQTYQPRLDLFRLDDRVATIIFPDVSVMPIEKAWRTLAQVSSAFGVTHMFFTHRGQHSIVSAFGSEPVEMQCFCIYFSCAMGFKPFVYPYVFSEDDNSIIWQDEASAQFDPIAEIPEMKFFFAISSQIHFGFVHPETFLEWLISQGFVVEFYEPFNERNFAATVT